ncbi:MAG: AraC family transcriptional regulator [Bacteroidales bacterium]|nr:AraC family transcriptional regulator [Bacteroidales bacterium]
MLEDIHLKYLVAGPNDLLWGAAVHSVGMQDVAPGVAYPPSSHPSRYLFSEERGRVLDEYQLLYITRGSGSFRSASLPGPVPLHQGYFFLLFPGEWHSYRPDTECGWKEYWIGFTGSQAEAWEKDGFFSRKHPIWNAGVHSDIVQLYDAAVRAASEQKSGFQQYLGGLVAHLMSLARFYGRNEAFSEVEDLINRAKILMTEEYRSIGAQDVAQRLYMSYSNFRKTFKEYTGLSPAKYIQQVKISKVKEALTNRSLPIKEIAFEAGYENYDYFFTSFRRLTGMTPAEYRRFTRGEDHK